MNSHDQRLRQLWREAVYDKTKEAALDKELRRAHSPRNALTILVKTLWHMRRDAGRCTVCGAQASPRWTVPVDQEDKFSRIFSYCDACVPDEVRNAEAFMKRQARRACLAGMFLAHLEGAPWA